MGICNCTSKALLGFLSILYWVIAACLIFVGAWVYVEYQHYDDITEAYFTLVPATALMGAGVLLFILGCIGCVGAFKEQKCLLACYFTILFLILLVIVGAAALGAVYKNDINSLVSKGLEKGLDDYNKTSENAVSRQIDFIQEKMKCCGVYNYTDWAGTPWYKAQVNKNVIYPASCCANKTCDYTTPPGQNNTMLYNQGCFSLVTSKFREYLTITLCVGGGIGLLQIVGMICACVLICRKKEENPYIGLNDPDALRV